MGLFWAAELWRDLGEVRDTSLLNHHDHQSDMGHVGENDCVREDIFEVSKVTTNVIV